VIADVKCPALLNSGLWRVQERLRKARKVTLFLNVDGALASGQSADELDPALRGTLQALAESGILVTLYSGRSLDDLRRIVGIDGIVYAGNHGLEIGGLHIQFVESVAGARRPLVRRLARDLSKWLEPFSEARVECKELSVSVHCREAAAGPRAAIEAVVREAVEASEPFFQMNLGRTGWDIVPRTDWHRGTSTTWIHERLTAGIGLLIYIGDDPGDEDAFRRFREGVTIRVGGPSASFANYYVPNAHGVYEFLEWLRAERG
jgi:trehalose 6-phosphate phosphatase